jgi:hypothetical protein
MSYSFSFIAGGPYSSGSHEYTDHKAEFRLPETGKTKTVRLVKLNELILFKENVDTGLIF